jgi:hypothetical protein
MKSCEQICPLRLVIGGLLFTWIGTDQMLAAEPPVTGYPGSAAVAMWSPPAMADAPHLVIRQPQMLSPAQAKRRAMGEIVHPPVATIQAATITPGWRQPYAYGYFGPKPHRHPQRHYGFNQDYTQWTWK